MQPAHSLAVGCVRFKHSAMSPICAEHATSSSPATPSLDRPSVLSESQGTPSLTTIRPLRYGGERKRLRLFSPRTQRPLLFAQQRALLLSVLPSARACLFTWNVDVGLRLLDGLIAAQNNHASSFHPAMAHRLDQSSRLPSHPGGLSSPQAEQLRKNLGDFNRTLQALATSASEA